MLAAGPIAPGVTVTPGVNDQFDLTGDGVIDNADVDQWLATGATSNGLGSAYQRGDSNVDAPWTVQTLGCGTHTNSARHCGGTMATSMAMVPRTVSDFGLWNANKFTSSDGVAAVPEPGTGIGSCVGLILLGAARTASKSPMQMVRTTRGPSLSAARASSAFQRARECRGR